MTYWLLKPIVLFLNNLPLGMLHQIGRLIAAATWRTSKERRRIATINAKIIGAEDPIKTARLSFDYTFMAYMETFYTHRITDRFIKEKVSVSGMENYREMREKYPDAIMAGGHFGTWAMLAYMFTKVTGSKVVTIGRATHNKALDRIMAELRTFDTVAYVMHRGAIDQLSLFMKEGYIPGAYLDHTAMPKDCVNVPFFGYKTPTIAGMYAMAARKNVPVLPVFGRFREDGGYEVMILPLVYPDKNLKPKERIEKLAADMNKVFEGVFSKYPEQWYLLHRRFKRVEEADGTLSDRVYRS